MHNSSHLGTGFRVWNREQTWFWSVINQDRNGGSVGVAATEAEAVREACGTIEETTVQPGPLPLSPRLNHRNASRSRLDRTNLFALAVLVWMCWLAKLAGYVSDTMPVYWAERPLRSSQ
jgi:hypothetical protein